MKFLFFLFFSFLVGADTVSERIDALNKFPENTSAYALLIDMSLPSTQKRLYLVELAAKKTIYSTYVAHGKGTGRGVEATLFSDVPGSYCTALGKYKVGKNYTGKHGSSYELTGLEKTNSNALSRAIVIHAAWYVEEDFIKKNNRCGNSWGCPAVSEEALKKLQPYLAEGTIVWIYK